MTWLREFASRFSALFSKRPLEQEMNDELRSHIEMLFEEKVRRGMPREEARRAAMRSFGGVDQAKEIYRDQRGLPMIENLLQDLRYGLRILLKNPGVTCVVVMSLALGIGANTAIFSLLNAVVLKSLPVPYAEQLVQFSFTDPGSGENSYMPYPYFERIRDKNQTLSGVFAFSGLGRVNVSLDGKSYLAEGQLATGGYFSVLGVTPAAGRLFAAEDDKARQPVAVISYGFWQKNFAGDPSLLGKTITLNQMPLTVIGVTPPRFFGLEVGGSCDITVPMMIRDQLVPGPPEWDKPFDTWLEIMGRLGQTRGPTVHGTDCSRVAAER
jgi:hypothetical protein